MAKEEPQRTCISCRKSIEKSKLLRFVLAPDGTVVPDLMNKLPGRGAYTCLTSDCIRQACERKQFSRAFRTEVPVVDPEMIQQRIVSSMEDRIASYLALANKAGKVVSGSDMVAEIIRKKTSVKKYVLLAADISEDIGKKIRGLAEQHQVRYATFFTKDRFGELLGKGLRSVVAIQGDGFVDTMNKEIERYRNFLRGEGCTYE
ncbi:MAG: DUF448 domain-containing protein [Geobacteraceae bacterium]|nr:DUF448 domain-containing protein [Geobacteraceae bacterium]